MAVIGMGECNKETGPAIATATNVEAQQADTVLYKTSLRSWAHNVMTTA